jgi:protein O-GlcNAc transferase
MCHLERPQRAEASVTRSEMSKPSIPKPSAEERLAALQRAIAFQQGGNLAGAEQLYRAILDAQPDQFDALHLLGVIRLQQRRNEEAIGLIRTALRVRPNVVEALSNLAKGLALIGRDDEAVEQFDRALAIRPDDPGTLVDRGRVLARLARHAEALASFQRAIAVNPNNVAAHYQLGRVLQAQGRHREALASFDQALTINRDFVEALDRRGLSLRALGRQDEALASYDKALSIRPDFVDALLNRGDAMLGLGRFVEALASYDRALAIKPGQADALSNRGVALKEQRRLDEALASYDSSLAIKLGQADALNNRGIALKEQRHLDEALASYDQALRVAPGHAEALVNRGIVLQLLGRDEEALASFDKALAVRPDLVDAHYNRATLLKSMNRFEEALAGYDKALALAQNHPEAYGAAEAALAICDWARVARAAAGLAADIAEGKANVTPFALLGLGDDPSLQLQCARNYIGERVPLRPEPMWKGGPPARRGDRIRIAYLSADFQDHATAYLAADLFELHDRSRFEVLGFSFGRDDGSEMRRRLIKAFDQFHDVQSKCDREIAQMLHDLNVDIAVDLKGHTKDARPEILSYRPAPIAVNYLGYPGTIGADFVDYIIADSIIAPFAHEPYFAEKIVHLPGCYQPNSTKRPAASRVPQRGEASLPNEGFVFCSFNNNYKITAPVFDVWMRLLQGVPGSVLWLLRDNAGAERNLRLEAQARGIDPARLIFAPRLALDEHLARQRVADLFLDTLPINAHTTASDALWAGLPIVTCRGNSFVARVAASILCAAGLPELVTENLAQYEACALRLATDQALLASIRRRLEDNRSGCALFDIERYTRQIEAAFTTMWHIAQRGEPPRSFSVAAI